MSLNLEAIKARAEAATPGPWQAIGAVISDGTGGVEGRAANAVFCAHARTDVPALVAEVERLRQSEDDLRTALRETMDELAAAGG